MSSTLGDKLGYGEGGPGYPALELPVVKNYVYSLLVDVEKKGFIPFGSTEVKKHKNAKGEEFDATEWVATVLVLATDGVHKEQEAKMAHKAHIDALVKAGKHAEAAAFKAANPVPTVVPVAGTIVRRYINGPRERALRETFKSIGYHNVKLDGTMVFIETYDNDSWEGYGGRILEKAAHIHTYELRQAGPEEAGWVPHAQNAKAALEARQATGRDTFERDDEPTDEPFPSTPAPGYATAPAAPVAPAPTPAYAAAPAAPQAPAAPAAPPAPAAPAAAAQSSFFNQARA